MSAGLASVLVALLLAGASSAHELRPGYLALRELGRADEIAEHHGELAAPVMGLFNLTPFPLDRNRLIGRCQRTQLEIPMR